MLRSFSSLAGHSDIRTTKRHYIAVREDDQRRARDVASETLAHANVAPASLKMDPK